MTRRILAAALFLTGTALLLTTPAAAVPVSGHRGAFNVPDVPEQSVAAVRYASNAGAVAVEGDVRWTRDGVMIMLHDATLDRTSDCVGRPEALTLAAIRRCSPSTATFTQWLTTARDLGLEVNAELKAIPGVPLTKAHLDVFVRRIVFYGMSRRAVVSSTSAKYLSRVRCHRKAQGVRTSLITDSRGSVSVKAARASGTVYMPHYSTLTPEKVKAYQSAGVKVWSWPGRTQADYVAMRDLGVDVIVADDPKAAVSWLKS